MNIHVNICKIIFPLDIKTDVRKGKECAKLEYITCLDKKLDLNRAFISPKETKETGSTTSFYTSEIPNTSTGWSFLSPPLSLSKIQRMSKEKYFACTGLYIQKSIPIR